MSEPFLGEIRMVGFNFAPSGWMLCNGQTLAINAYAALFSLLGTTFGGNGTSTFQLPDLQGRVPVNVGNGAGLSPVVWGEVFGQPQVTLNQSNLPAHAHTITPPATNSAGTSTTPGGQSPAQEVTTVTLSPSQSFHANAETKGYGAAVAGQNLAAYSSGLTGGNTSVNIQPPSLGIYFIIAYQGIFPSKG
jgi:microcystin-dependent protein